MHIYICFLNIHKQAQMGDRLGHPFLHPFTPAHHQSRPHWLSCFRCRYGCRYSRSSPYHYAPASPGSSSSARLSTAVVTLCCVSNRGTVSAADHSASGAPENAPSHISAGSALPPHPHRCTPRTPCCTHGA